MTSSRVSSSSTHVRFVVYCDEETDPYTLPDVQLPRTLEGVRQLVEEAVGKRAKLLSYWNYTHSRYELLREVKELLQPEGRIPCTNGTQPSRPGSRRMSAEREATAAAETNTSRSAVSSSTSVLRTPSVHVYRCQVWLETVLLRLEPLDPHRNAAEYDELNRHVSRWLGNKHIGYEVRDAVRIHCPFLTRMFDETRSARLADNQDKVQLLYYTNNAWSVRDVLQYGFLLHAGVPSSMTAVVQAQGGVSDISTTTDTRLSIPVPAPVHGAAGGPAPPTLADDPLDSLAHPFIFTSSMLGPNVRHLPPRTPPHKVLLCEVAPGRRFMTDHSLTGEQTDKHAFPVAGLRAPHGYDSVCYMRTNDDKPGVRSGIEAGTKAEDLSVVQVQVGHSYQALPRYLLTVAPTGGPPPALPSLASTVSSTASPVRVPGSTAAAAAARKGSQKQQAAAARSGRLQQWMRASPSNSYEGGDEGSRGTPRRRPASSSAPSAALQSTPRQDMARQGPLYNAMHNQNSSSMSRDVYVSSKTPRRAVSAFSTPRCPPLQSPHRVDRGGDTLYPDDGSAGDEQDDRLLTPRAHSRPRPSATSGRLSVSQSSPWPPSSPPHRRPSGSGELPLYGNGDSLNGSLRPAPPTPPSSARPGTSSGNRTAGLLYRGLPSAERTTPSVDVSDRVPQPSSSWLSPPRWRASPERGGAPPHSSSLLQPENHSPHDGSPSRPPAQSLVPSYADPASPCHNTSCGVGGDGGAYTVPLPAPLPPASITHKAAPPLPTSSSYQRPQQGPPAAFNQFLCPIHPRQLQSLYCTACEELTCPYCGSVGAHRDHIVVEASDRITAVHAEVHKLHEELRHWLNEYQRTEQELRSEQASWAARQQRELHTLQHNFQLLRQSLQLAERTMTQALQQRSCPPPLNEASAVIGKYVQALAPLSAALRRYHAAQDPSVAPAPPPLQPNSSRGTTRSVPEMLHFLHTAPPLLHRVQESFVQHHQDEERRLRDGIAAFHARVSASEGVFDHVDWVGLRRLLERIGSSRSTRPARIETTRERSHTSHSPPRPIAVSGSLSFSGQEGQENGGSRAGSAARVRGCGRPSPRSSPSRSTMANSRDAARRLGGRSPVRSLVIGDDLTSYVSHHAAPSPKVERLLLRCLADLQRGHIWAIQDASFYFAPGQLKAVCSTAFRLVGAQWELRIAPLPSSHRAARRSNSAPTTSLNTPGADAGMMAATASTLLLGGGDREVAARSPLTTHSLPDEGHAGLDTTKTSSQAGSFEEEWLGLFVFPLQHRLRMDFRVIAFSEVTWAEWQVTGWTPEMAGKGWGLYPFLQRKELMRTDKLARDNIVKICIAPISDCY